jgi:UDP-N-acetylglucosamine:LPS N-acetylglucosamine transferase
MFGGYGSPQMARIARRLDDQQLVLMCGHNARLAEALRAMTRSAPHAVLGFTTDVQRYMRAADWFVGKPGPGALSEALQCALPVITFRNAWTMPQERFNTEWIEQQGLGLVIESARELPMALATLLAELSSYRDRVTRIENRAVFELPGILDRIMTDRAGTRTARRAGLGIAA